MDLDTKNLYRKVGLRIFKEIILPEWPKILITISLMIIIALSNSGQAYLIKPAIDSTLFQKEGGNHNYLLYVLPMLIIGVTIIKGLSTYLQTVMSSNLNVRMTNRVRARMYERFIKSDLIIFNQKSSGEMLSNMVNDINGMMTAVTLLLSGVFKNFFSVAFLVAVMIYMNPMLSLISMVGVPFAIIPIYLVYKKLTKYMTSNQVILENYMVQIEDTLRSVRVVKAYNAETYEVTRLRKTLDGMYKMGQKISRISNIPSPMNETLIGVGIASVLAYGGSLVASGESTPGAFFAFFTAMMMAYRPAKSIGNLNTQMHMALICGARVFGILDTEPKLIEKPDAVELRIVKGEIKFDKVGFAYNEGKNVLKNVSLNLEAGKTYALVGHSGGGKSTIMNLILRFYDPNSGTIKLDGHDLRDLKIGTIRDSISYVGQEIQLFDDTIRENIRYGKMDATDEEIAEAAKKAEAHEFIEKTELGYANRIGQNGLKLSGGQRQRISIARAILKNSPVLLLDEATSALDPISEKLIQQALTKLMKNRTTLVIAHRLSTVINADEIFVVANGEITESGTHEELLAKNGGYANLYLKQFESNSVEDEKA